ncbi:hypothetical protein [Bacillus anthracis]|uniref:hypothetical protein n=1 Tax=Bacillus anthracis TaxID=1392 RepID=UPI001301D059|nr:hypothetical protein [Bacillus anthracis]
MVQPFLQDFQLDALENNAYMIFNKKSFPSRKNDASNSLVIDFKETINTFRLCSLFGVLSGLNEFLEKKGCEDDFF